MIVNGVLRTLWHMPYKVHCMDMRFMDRPKMEYCIPQRV